ncbi:hypothetical protein GCM10022255_089280 [Dactylosporangium darangshiense]|uniref:Uncharacterized protein n=1 Tax=Dactylosporangium darangshiense TaxID=579108 RepID=A0ABP8DNL0_9ACTN
MSSISRRPADRGADASHSTVADPWLNRADSGVVMPAASRRASSVLLRDRSAAYFSALNLQCRGPQCCLPAVREPDGWRHLGTLVRCHREEGPAIQPWHRPMANP